MLGDAAMSRTEKKKFEMPSTVEAIRMASASILGTTTNLGYPLGSAVGSGSMMEENSDTVAMNITPLIFSIRDALMGAEGLEILSLEWDLERTPGPGVLPEQLIVTGGTTEGIGSHVCMLSWEKGAVDPFKIDTHMRRLSKKLADIETAVMNNGLSYETEGLPILRRFNDRFNRVIFVEMLDRRFQGSWDSFQLKQDQVDIEAQVTLNFHDDFTLLPPGPKITERTMLDFVLPPARPEKLLEHFKHRVLTPTGIEALAVKVPEAGRAILSEMNAYAFSIEEVNLAQMGINLLVEYLGFNNVSLDQFAGLTGQTREFVALLSKTIASFEEVVNSHVGSGTSSSVSGHKTALLSEIDLRSDWFDGFGKTIALKLVDELVSSIERTFAGVSEIRAWQLRSTVSYFMIYAKQVQHYFEGGFSQYLLITSARKAFVAALQSFRIDVSGEISDAIFAKLFEKLYAEIYSRLNAVFDRVAYTGAMQHSFSELLTLISQEMVSFFEEIDIWDLIEFADIADIARAEIDTRYGAAGALDATGKALQDILATFENLVTYIIPDVADTLLSKAQIRRAVARCAESPSSLFDSFIEYIETGIQKPDEWKDEAKNWINSCKQTISEDQDPTEQLLALVRFVHTKVGLGATAQAIVDKITFEADERETAFGEVLDQWQRECQRIDTENEPIRDNNRKRADAMARAQNQYAQEMTRYEAEMARYRAEVEASKNLPEGTQPPVITEPSRPKSLDARTVEINNQYPEMQEKPMPPEPDPPEDLAFYVGVRDLLGDQLRKMDVKIEQLQAVFTDRLQGLKSAGTAAADGISVSLEDDFLEYLKNSSIRGLGKLLPKPRRAYLRNPQIPDLIFLVTYDQKGDEMNVTISNNFLRLRGGA
ncbi:MAG: hypothetical protein EAX95_06595 [Candidatus Thorarchaeota archaeon]|nr:hypothetical protein [Candidatus Thorarchaeota archaeon]